MNDETRQRKSGLSHEDRIIWEKVTRTVQPISGRAPFSAALEETMAELLAEESSSSKKRQIETLTKDPSKAPSQRTEPRLHPIEKPTLRKIKKGRITIDGRIDLHGLKRAEAHNLLYGFLAQARERGMRHVLVITGKGRSGGSEGVLRREVPHWLEKPEFRLLVSGLETSAHGHGGDGALYIRLRRQGG